MPLTGGSADKAGNTYERRWTVFTLLDLLEGLAQTIRIEVPGDDGVGAEFRLMVGGVPTWHQAKRQRDGGPWTIANMANEGVFVSWWPKIQAGGRCVFVSSTGAQELRELVERASGAESWAEFSTEFLTRDQTKRFQRLRSAWGDPPEEAVYQALGSIVVRLLGEPELAGYVEARLASLVTAAPATAASVLAQLVDDSCHRELTADDVWRRLAANGAAPRNLSRDAAVVRRLSDTAELYLRRLRPLYIGGRELPRGESEDAFSRLAEGRRVLIAGAAGSGKSVIAGHVTDLARRAGWTILVLAVDRLPDADTTYGLGTAIGLPDSPPITLAGASGGGDALLVLDQLDAVSVASGRHPERLGVVEDLLGQAASHPRLRVLLACRQFDLDNDRELRAVAADELTAIVSVGRLDQGVVRQALDDVGLPSDIPWSLGELLTVPLHLAIYVELARAGLSDVFGIRSLTELYDQYWSVKREACRTARGGTDEWLAVVDRLVELMSAQQKLSVPAAVLDDLDKQVRVMASQSVLVSENERVSFFHETFFDYCFARRFVSDKGNLRELLASQEQDLFRRAQVRQLLTYERVAAFQTYLSDFAWLLTADDVRLHIKALVVALTQTVADPQPAEWTELRPIAIDPANPLHGRLWQALRRNPAWFPVLHAEGDWSSWLSSADATTTDWALWTLTGMSGAYPADVAGLLRAMPAGEAGPNRLRGFLRMADVHAGRPLFELLLVAVNDGYYDGDQGHDLWFTMRELATHQPEWAVEVLAALLLRALAGGADDPFIGAGPLSADRNSLADETVRVIAQAAPAAFVELLLPPILEIARRNERPDWGGVDVLLDAVWGIRFYDGHTALKDDLYAGMEDALGSLAQTDATKAATVFDQLRADSHESAWFLLAGGYAANPDRFVDEAVTWLAGTPGALHLGYSDAPHWVSRGLVAAVSSVCSDVQLNRLIDALIGYTPPFERTYKALRHRGYGELCLLNALDHIRRPDRVERRLAELRRKFQLDDVEPPRGIEASFVPPPIPEDRATKMTDDQWLRAMARHGTSDVRFRPDGRLVGDAATQAQVLEAVTRASPERFARLLLRLPTTVAEPYIGGILRGLAGARLDAPQLLGVCQRAREIGDSDTNRWIVRLIETEAAATLPDELLDIVIDIATADPDPTGSGLGGDPDSAGLNSTRGAAALALAALIGQNAGRLPHLRDALAHLSRDPAIAVRAMAAAALTNVIYVDAALALDLFRVSLADAGDELLTSHYVERFLNQAVRRGHYPTVAEVFTRMIGSTVEDVRRAGARQLAVASYRHPDLDPLVDAALNSDETTRAGVVEVFADNVTAPDRSDRANTVLIRAFGDPSPVVRSSAIRCFYGLDKHRLDDYLPLIEAFGNSTALHDHAQTVFHVLESARQPLPVAVLDLCERFTAAHGAALADISTAAAGAGMNVVELAVRLHAQHADPDTRRRCLDLIDQLVVLGVYGIDDNLALIER